MDKQSEEQFLADEAQEAGHTAPLLLRISQVAVSLNRVYPRCGSLKVERLARGRLSRYECGNCDRVFRGVRILGMRVQW